MGSGRPKLYWPLVKDLENEKVLSIADLVNRAAPDGFPENIVAAHGLAEARERAVNALRGRARKYKIPYRVVNGQRLYMAFQLKLSFSDPYLKKMCLPVEYREIKRLEKEASAPPPKFQFRKIKRPLIIVAGVLAFTAAVATLKPRVYEILQTQGISAAWSYISTVEGEDAETVYQRAWIEYRADKHAAASQKALALLGDRHTPIKRRADCFYLLAEIKSATGQYRISLGHYTEAHMIYWNLNRPQNLYLTSLGKAKALTFMGMLVDAEAELDNAFGYYRASGGQGNPGLYYSLLTSLEMRKTDYQKALNAALATVSIYEKNGNNDGLATALSDVGFLNLILGNTEQGLAYTRRAEYLIVELSDRGKYVCNLVNYVLHDRMQGRESVPFVIQTIEDWIDRYNNRDLEYYLDLTETVN